MTDNLTATQKREAIKIAKRKVERAIDGVLKDCKLDAAEGKVAPPEVQKAWKALRRAEKAEAALAKRTSVARQDFYESMGYERRSAGNTYRVSQGHIVDGDKVRILSKGASPVAHAFRGNGRNAPPTKRILENLENIEFAQPYLDAIYELTEFIEVELPADMWLTTTDAYKALSELDARIAGIIAR